MRESDSDDRDARNAQTTSTYVPRQNPPIDSSREEKSSYLVHTGLYVVHGPIGRLVQCIRQASTTVATSAVQACYRLRDLKCVCSVRVGIGRGSSSSSWTQPRRRSHERCLFGWQWQWSHRVHHPPVVGFRHGCFWIFGGIFRILQSSDLRGGSRALPSRKSLGFTGALQGLS